MLSRYEGRNTTKCDGCGKTLQDETGEEYKNETEELNGVKQNRWYYAYDETLYCRECKVNAKERLLG